MKRVDLIKHLTENGCELRREGRKHSIWTNPATRVKTAVPRHNEVNDNTAKAICRQLGVPDPE